MSSIVRFKMASKPGEVDINNRTYTKENLDDIRNSEYTQNLIKIGALFVKSHYIDNGHLSLNVDLEYIIGIVVYWGDDYVEVRLKDKYDHYFDNKIDDYRIGMSTIGNIETSCTENNEPISVVTHSRILYFALLFKNLQPDPVLMAMSVGGDNI